MCHTLTTFTPKTGLTFKVILKELISSAITNRRACCLKPQTIPKTPIQPSACGVNPTVTPVATAVASTSLPPKTFLPTPSTTSSGNIPPKGNPNRVPPQTKSLAAETQGGRVKINRPVTSQVVVQLLNVLDEVTEEIQCEEIAEEANSVEEVLEIAEQFQDYFLAMTDEMPEVYFTSEIKDKDKEEFVEVITLSLTSGAAFLVIVTGDICNTLTDTGATRSCISKTFL